MAVETPTTASTDVTDGCIRIRLHDVAWDTYVALRDQPSNNGVRMTYDNGELLLMSPGFRHGRRWNVLCRLVGEWTLERGLPLMSGGDLTMRIKEKKLGLEPDNCFWSPNESKLRGIDEWERRRDPPPDLVIEVDVTSDSLTKLHVYAQLAVPEVWHDDGHSLRFLRLAGDEYEESTHSVTFPDLASADLATFFDRTFEDEENAIVRDFRSWIREHFDASS